MRYFILLCAGVCFSVFAHTQTVKVNSSPTDKLKVTLLKDRLSIVYDNREIPAATVRVLDSLIRKVPDPKNLTIEFENRDAEPEKIRSIDAVLKQCHCPVTKHSIKVNPN